VVSISALAGRTDLKELECVDCGAHIRHTNGYLKATSKKYVHAYLGLWPGDDHVATCPNTMRAQMNLIVAKSKAATGDEVLADDGGATVFRLHVLTERMEAASAANTAAANANPGPNGTRTQYDRTSDELENYLNTATAIARLYARLQDAQDANAFKARLRIQHRNRTLHWNDFFYEPERYAMLVKRLADKKRRLTHPIALVVDAQWFGDYTPKNGPANSGRVLNGTLYPPRGPGRVQAQAYAPDPAALQRARRGMPHIIVGLPFLGPFKTGSDIGLRVMVHFPAQIAVVIETEPRPEQDGNQPENDA
jgi:hypothetical protein